MPGIAPSSDDTPASSSGVIVYPPKFFESNRPDTAYDMIERVPSFQFDAGDQSSRGLAGASGNVLIDGDRPSSKSDSLDEVLRRIAALSVDRIELIRGGAPGIDMQGRTVVANVVLKKGATGELAIEAAAYGYRNGDFGPQLTAQYSRRNGDSQTEASIFATTDRSDGTANGARVRSTANDTVPQTADLDLRDRFRNINARGVIQRRVAGGKLRINALADYFFYKSSQAVTIRSGGGSDAGNRDRNPSWQFELGLDWTRALGPRSEVELTALQRNHFQNYNSVSLFGTDPSTFGIKSNNDESIGRAVWRLKVSKKWAFEAGGEFAYNDLDSTTRFTDGGLVVPLPNAVVFVSELRGEGFVQATWQPSDKLTVESALRGEISRIAQTGDTDLSKSFFYPKGRLQISWESGTDQQLRLRVERSIGQLDFEDFVASTETNLGNVVGGNADLVPQRQTVFEVVYEYRFWKKGAIELTAQHVAIQDVVDIIPLEGGFEAIGNIGNGTAELLQGRLTLPFDKIGLKDAILTLRASWQKSSVIDPLTGDGRRLSNQIPFGCGIAFDHDLKGGRFSYGVEHGCNLDRSIGYRVREIRTSRSSPYLSAYGQWKPRSDLTVRLELGNVSNQTVHVNREIHDGRRDVTPIAFIEDRRLRSGAYAFLKLRKTL